MGKAVSFQNRDRFIQMGIAISMLRKAFAFLHKRRPTVPYVRRRAAFA